MRISKMKAIFSLQVVIVGAGLGGLGTAISLRKAGHKVIVLEQAPEFIEVVFRNVCAKARPDKFAPRSVLVYKYPPMPRESS